MAEDTQDITGNDAVEWPCETQGDTLANSCTLAMLLPLTQLKYLSTLDFFNPYEII